ncbi:hypothetical protein M041_gp52 [Mycobacterium phage Severus]|uniref:hypothetical protein n=1 Tax=Mycobacterium phage Severus TaxID=1327776 RepID=UPI00032B32DD|nr:hypothetical protein M041_gp52 [Mycobacterium phage Severus]AVO22435.1 hypothetical protein SEA_KITTENMITTENS_34 [Mycobacterium phage KittenMittens]QWS69319.1 hypothetical protein SEA_PEACEMEAL1_35 [Mycobacterium Phage PeaceMeal1]QZD97019.1 hypothetical protein SEA_DRAKE94_35 [Mycobacterium phage Drake94]USL89169.1 hypothetical protein SEA_POOMPHA_36 [Mycobacterium phage Poompha]AGK87967.1 hypothetical protein PBI_SEVERUS_35 [Mycobacterium phage Severus]
MKKIAATIAIAAVAAAGLTACEGDTSCDAMAVDLRAHEAPLGPVIVPRPPVPVVPRPVSPARPYTPSSPGVSTGQPSWLLPFIIGAGAGTAASC